MRFEVYDPNLLMMGIISTPVSNLLEDLENDIVNSELYKMGLFSKEFGGAMRLYFKWGNGYYNFTTPLIDEESQTWTENTRIYLKFEKVCDNREVSNYLGIYDFVAVFGFPIPSRYSRPLFA